MNKQINPLEKFKEKYNLWINDQVLTLNHSEINEIEALIQAKHPDYRVMKWCGHCIGEMFKLAFNVYEKEIQEAQETAKKGKKTAGNK